MMNSFDKWFDTFLEEKDVPFNSWEIEDTDGMTHFIDSEVVIDHIKLAPESEKKSIKDILVKIDYANGDVNHFFKHIAKGLVETYL